MLAQELPVDARIKARSATDGIEIVDGRYRVKLATTLLEVESALRLRYEVFRMELSEAPADDDPSRLEFDEHDFKCRHLIVIDRTTAKTVGTYRLNSIESSGGLAGFYSYGEFQIEELPADVLRGGVEIGRACITPEHRNTKVLFLLWKGLATYLRFEGKRFFFGCCSIFTRDESVGARAWRYLATSGCLHESFRVVPRKNCVDLSVAHSSESVELPNLFNMYLRIGARVCGPPVIDHEFGTIDFFVVCDTETINHKYRRMFFS
ncbi:MAG TPA: GNAT family N-acyltransferase [Pyrinomonadaceae bacterium]